VFDIGFSELLLVFVIGLVVLGPQRLPIAVKTVVGWIRTIRAMAASVQSELSQELKLQELQDSLKQAEASGLQNLTPELKASMDQLRNAAESMKRSYKTPLADSSSVGEAIPAQTATVTSSNSSTVEGTEQEKAQLHPDATTPVTLTTEVVVGEKPVVASVDTTLKSSPQPTGER
jgi:sec-independent protein translocase protein TatB